MIVIMVFAGDGDDGDGGDGDGVVGGDSISDSGNRVLGGDGVGSGGGGDVYEAVGGSDYVKIFNRDFDAGL